ncbi:hypothetical protein J4H86_20765 [Spiractinospora alimapuensis]|uniref:hypothetical protein n=1 Tax=Spiractinospora alimapuensis TaxID=2820884 RepID=UPI001F1DAA40|nr:hypothetical protein [Spiractinospora alimapuensis]QVQ51232.1 hypothetical protein J4H86_20765 [Spiractinospora alimapuensis]
MNIHPPNRLLALLTPHGDVFFHTRKLPNGQYVRCFSMRQGPTAEWHGTHWRIDDHIYGPHTVATIARILTTQWTPDDDRT